MVLDIGQAKLDFAKENGTHEAFMSNAEAADKVESLTNGRGDRGPRLRRRGCPR